MSVEKIMMISNRNFKGLKNYQKCYLRDNEIVESLEKMKILNTEQIAILFFENRIKVAQKRLKILSSPRKQKLKRFELKPNYPYCYHLPDYKLNKQIEHIVATNWVYVWFKLNLRSNYESIYHFSYEKQNEIFRYDAFIGIDNKFTNEKKFYFIEVDLSNNKFDKIKKYNEFYSKKLYQKQWWLEYAKGFPTVFILTHRERHIRGLEKKENVEGLEFKIYGLDLIEKMRELVRN